MFIIPGNFRLWKIWMSYHHSICIMFLIQIENFEFGLGVVKKITDLIILSLFLMKKFKIKSKLLKILQKKISCIFFTATKSNPKILIRLVIGNYVDKYPLKID